MAEAHPVGFRWVMAAKERGATLIHVDPRFSRTSALADLWLPIRAGSDIAFLGGLIHYALEHERYFKDYVVHYTNATAIINEDFRMPDDGLDGFFSGWQLEHRFYDPKSWRYDSNDLSHPNRDLTLRNPRCVFQLLKRHYARYTPEMVEKVCGIPQDLFLQAAEKLTSASGPDKTAALIYAVGFTHQSKGAQVIRTASILQLLLGNIGRPGGGIMALRGHASIQGSTDIPTLYDVLPGYLSMPRAGMGEDTLQDYINKHANPTGLWNSFGKYFISLLKAYYGKNATPENEFGFRWFPKISGDHSYFKSLYATADGKVGGYFIMGQNPAVGAQNGRLERKALANLKWMVVREMVEIETATFWLNSPEIERGELKTEDIATEVFLMPAAGHAEKQGAFTNTQRLVQWREKAVEPPGDCKSDGWFIHQLAKRLKAKAAASDDPMDEALRALDWWYPEEENGEPDMEAVLAEINGWHTARQRGESGVFVKDVKGQFHHGRQLDHYQELADDGSTAAGCWIYTGIFGSDGVNKAKQREPRGPYGHGWGFAWPSDRRILYNRASAKPDGTPWSERKKLIWWDASEKRWAGDDVPDFPPDKPPDYQPPKGATGLNAHPGDRPFLLLEDGLGAIYVPKGLEDGPFPTHFEPLESPVHNEFYSRDTNPPIDWFTRADNRFAPPADPRFPHILTTYRLTEHHTAGGMSRWLSHLAELMPSSFVEMSPELAAELKIKNGDEVIVATMRAAVGARALVSRRLRPLRIGAGQHLIHQVAMPFHWGGNGPVKGDSANDLLAISGEPNVTIMETKALTCAIIPGQLPRGAAYLEFMNRIAPPTADPNLHPEQPPPGAPEGGKFASGYGQYGKAE